MGHDFSSITSTLFVGPMKSGKSLELLKVAHDLDSKKIPYLAFKPKADTRDVKVIRSRCPEYPSIPAKMMAHPQSIVIDHEKTPVSYILIDEVNLFCEEIVGTIHDLRMLGVHLYCSGLDLDFRGMPFPIASADPKTNGPGMDMLDLIAEFDQVINLLAECEVCGLPAAHTQRLRKGKPVSFDSPLLVIEGDNEYTYQARCSGCHRVPGKRAA